MPWCDELYKTTCATPHHPSCCTQSWTLIVINTRMVGRRLTRWHFQPSVVNNRPTAVACLSTMHVLRSNFLSAQLRTKFQRGSIFYFWRYPNFLQILCRISWMQKSARYTQQHVWHTHTDRHRPTANTTELYIQRFSEYLWHSVARVKYVGKRLIYFFVSKILLAG